MTVTIPNEKSFNDNEEELATLSGLIRQFSNSFY